MEYYWTMLNNNNSSSTSNCNSNSNSLRGHNGNFTTNNHAWESSDLGSSSSSSRVDWSNPLHHSLNYTPSAAAGELHALMLHQQEESGAHYYKPDPHLMCLKLGKRHYFENVSSAPVIGERHVAAAMPKKGKPCREIVGGPSPAPPPRCQVEGCEVVLVNAKDYHRRHKVCEMHAKAPRVVVLGIEQRFCQQCSRFHGVGEFDESKRSCRRRLAGHNERRRKSSQDHSLPRKSSQDIKMMSVGRPPHYLNSSECALSLLSSTNNIPWNIPAAAADLPARCSAALHELIAENRASILAYRQQLNSNQMQDHFNNHKNNGSIRAGSNPRFFNLHENDGHVTLDLMQDPNSAFGLLSVHDHKSSKEGGGEEDCSELWKFPLGY